MLSEFIHSIVDCGNQSLLLIGLRHSSKPTDRYHQYGYGKSIYFWALISALGTFFLGAGVSLTQALPNLIIHGGSIEEITWHVWAVLCFSFVVDGYVFVKTINEIREGGTPTTTSPIKNESESGKLSLWKQIRNVRDPATLAILLEDGAACAGIIFAIMGIALTSLTNMPVFDALAGVAISSLLAVMGIILVQVNHRFLLGQAVDPEIIKGIEKILLSSKSIDHVYSVQSQWTGPETFSYKAEVDFDGTYLAAKLMPRYQQEFVEARATLDQDLRVLLSWYAEDVMRTVEREVKYIEAEIRKQYPGAQYIELEPMSKDADRFAIDDGMEAQIKRIEIENLNRYLRSLVRLDNIFLCSYNIKKLDDDSCLQLLVSKGRHPEEEKRKTSG
jgi:zinc transporter 9